MRAESAPPPPSRIRLPPPAGRRLLRTCPQPSARGRFSADHPIRGHNVGARVRCEAGARDPPMRDPRPVAAAFVPTPPGRPPDRPFPATARSEPKPPERRGHAVVAPPLTVRMRAEPEPPPRSRIRPPPPAARRLLRTCPQPSARGRFSADHPIRRHNVGARVRREAGARDPPMRDPRPVAAAFVPTPPGRPPDRPFPATARSEQKPLERRGHAVVAPRLTVRMRAESEPPPPPRIRPPPPAARRLLRTCPPPSVRGRFSADDPIRGHNVDPRVRCEAGARDPPMRDPRPVAAAFVPTPPGRPPDRPLLATARGEARLQARRGAA